MAFMRYIDLYFKLVAAGIRAQLQYRFAFFMRIVGMLTSYAGTAITMWVMLYQFQELGTWNFYEMLFLFAIAVLSWGFCIILFFHFRSLDTYILNGTFDRFLVRPINPFFHFMAMKFDVASFGQFIFSIFIFIWVSAELQIHWTIANVLFLFAAVIGGVLIQGGLLVIISAFAFWTTKSEQFYWVVMYPARNLTNYPLVIYPKMVQWFMAFVVPFGFVNYFPASVILGKETPYFSENIGYFSPLVGIVFFIIAYYIWMLGLSRYKSTGS
ncbi:ABC-2 family transporter protein [Cytobacillus sp. Sa5YUA1]|uniref:ABC-2 family transporter protein n=1 Tax=Cytobacillus stercorigallinarum TaxID=2762240 RepID=A0ABR8QTQ4_9BACI|nr:ABC-2 family transporter protein [Cytobacillus stercorigallinarum]MBD7938817.1 ABC-2 family transporter protein [Cytobacillus stercorigallinarum]